MANLSEEKPNRMDGNVERTTVKILIVDDESAIREVLSASLADEGYIVKVARSGEEGLRMMEEFQARTSCLLDIWMPGSMDGIEVLSSRPQSLPWH